MDKRHRVVAKQIVAKTKKHFKFICFERGPETIIFGISVKNCADSTKNQPRRPSLRLFGDIVANSGKIWQFSKPRKSIENETFRKY
jgi:hypothetical protein